ncbi:DUF397 domain-containing protein [Streptomyces sp. SID3343]|uniref:DUF397 domain-containing protein n=1 Tax=Streptomyces sp. SID3343 TaxID=2690260 RepID=UPI001368A91D|nr:DUF397 domain-containing protein [Streptomyces sp. SID3343]MYV98950.1 DUF397 domain-containing protein [Streptomyces sp. SID3343]
MSTPNFGGSVIETEGSIRWRKSSYSVDDGSCVEIAPLERNVVIRDSKLNRSPVIGFGGNQWTTFVGSLT